MAALQGIRPSVKRKKQKNKVPPLPATRIQTAHIILHLFSWARRGMKPGLTSQYDVVSAGTRYWSGAEWSLVKTGSTRTGVEFNEFRSKCGLLWSYDWVSIPLVYTQNATTSLDSQETFKSRNPLAVLGTESSISGTSRLKAQGSSNP
uniref:Bestrophin homolog n=1 Tax=Timema tahoe TaxID=61484 RepID=A0A7R9IK45_9NEOP|nr:unnamed protein product [Timema tahoe]